MFKDYESPLEAVSPNWVSHMLSRFCATLVDYSKHDIKFSSRGGVLVPIRVKSPINVNMGYSITVSPGTVQIYAANIQAQGLADVYNVTIPRAAHDPRHWQLKKMDYREIFATFIRKVYTKSIGDCSLRFTKGRDPSAQEELVGVMSYVNVLVDLLKSEKSFTMYFYKNRWTITTRHADAGEEVLTWFTSGTTSAVGRGNRGNNSKVRREAKMQAAMGSAP